MLFKKKLILTTKPTAKISLDRRNANLVETFTKSKKGNSWEMMKLDFSSIKTHSFEITLEKEKGELVI